MKTGVSEQAVKSNKEEVSDSNISSMGADALVNLWQEVTPDHDPKEKPSDGIKKEDNKKNPLDVLAEDMTVIRDSRNY